MRLLAALLLALPAAAQTPLYDADFEFRITPPEGMRLVTAEELRAFAVMQGLPEDRFDVVPRDESPDGVAVHEYKWRDLTGHEREMSVTLKDRVEGEEVLLEDPDAWATALEANFGVDVSAADRDFVRHRNGHVLGLRAEFDRQRQDGAQLRQISAYVVLKAGDPVERDRVAVVHMQALKADWDAYEPAFEAVLDSMSFPLPKLATRPPPGTGPAAARRGATGGGAAATSAVGGETRPEEGWGGLQVTGSLLLALVLLGSLFVGGSAAGRGAA